MNPMLIGALAGLGKSILIDQPREERQRMLSAQTALYSPWTGLRPQQVQEADPFGTALQGLTAGALFQSMNPNGLTGSEQAAMQSANPYGGYNPNVMPSESFAMPTNPYGTMSADRYSLMGR